MIDQIESWLFSTFETFKTFDISSTYHSITSVALKVINNFGKFLQEISGNPPIAVDNSKKTPKPEKKQEPVFRYLWEGYLEDVAYNVVGENFCAFWDLPEAIRDLLQNAIDSMFEVHRAANPQCKSNCLHWISVEKPPHTWQENQGWIVPFYLYQGSQRQSDPCGYICWKPKQGRQGPILTIINKGANFGSEALTVGCTTKKSDSYDAGGHGEGLKAIIATAFRKDLRLEIYQSGVALEFQKYSSILSVKVRDTQNKELRFRELTEEYCKGLNVSPDKDVIIHLGDGKNLQLQHVRQAAEKFLSLTYRKVEVLPPKDSIGDFKPVVVYSTSEKIGNMMVRRGLLRGPDLEHKVYVRGILFNADADDQTQWGVDLAREDARNRDRAYVFPYEYSLAVGKIITGFIDNSSDTEFVKHILKEFEFAAQTGHCPEHLKALARTATDKTRRILQKVFKTENPDAKYLFPGLAFDKKNDLTPRWCDFKICRMVHPVLYELLQKGEYPSIEKIRVECIENLKKAPVFKEDTQNLRQWIRENQKFVFSSQTLSFDEKYLQQIEVRVTNAPNVPLFIVIPGRPLPKIVFSQRSLQLNEADSQMQFLSLIREALDEGFKKDEKKPQQPAPEKKPEEAAPPPKKEEIPKTSYILKKEDVVAAPAQKGNILATPIQNKQLTNDDKPDIVRELQKKLTNQINFNGRALQCTPESRKEWEAAIASNPAFVVAVKQSMEICIKGIKILCGNDATLNFYLAKETCVLGFANRQSIHMNLVFPLLFLSAPSLPTYQELWAYYLPIIAHEHAHFVKDDDGHSQDHGARTEQNIHMLLNHWDKETLPAKL